jgi:hypothetical protein
LLAIWKKTIIDVLNCDNIARDAMNCKRGRDETPGAIKRGGKRVFLS